MKKLKFNPTNVATLYHYLFELSDQLRPVIGKNNYDDINEEHFTQKLDELKQVIDNCFETSNEVEK